MYNYQMFNKVWNKNEKIKQMEKSKDQTKKIENLINFLLYKSTQFHSQMSRCI